MLKLLTPVQRQHLQHQQTTEGKIRKIKFTIKTLSEKPKFFLSPLYIVKLILKTRINTHLVKLRNELEELKI